MFDVGSIMTLCFFVVVVVWVKNRSAIIECIILYDALHQRTVYLDAICSGLEVIGVRTIYDEDLFRDL